MNRDLNSPGVDQMKLFILITL